MPATVRSVLVGGVDGTLIDIECHLSNGLPNIVIVGIASKSIDEAKERIRSAFANSGLKLPRKRITINLAPADIPKEGSSYDLPIATAILSASQIIKHSPTKKEIIIGELGLNGDVRPVRGILGKLIAGKKLGVTTFFIPESNFKQALLIPNIKLIPISSLKELSSQLNQEHPDSLSTGKGAKRKVRMSDDEETDFKYIVGQLQAKRALEIAAAGQHNILFSGPPGVGKSLMAKAFATIIPPLSQEEVVETTNIHSLAGKNFQQIVDRPPFRAPHHSSSDISIIGGGQNPRPGEVSLSHNGVLFLDELPEFSRSSIEALRQPLEDKVITVARAKETLQFPAKFTLIATQNPCPCGYWGSEKACICLPSQIVNYRKKISGPIVDRIDLFVNVGGVDNQDILSKLGNEEPSQKIAERVLNARQKQLSRQNKLNSELRNKDIRTVRLNEPTKALLDQAAERFELSARAYIRAIKLARTIADLGGSNDIDASHMGEALQYRHQPQLL